MHVVNTCFNCRNGSTIIDFELEKRIPVSENTDNSANATAMEFQMSIQTEVNKAVSNSIFKDAAVDDMFVANIREGCMLFY